MRVDPAPGQQDAKIKSARLQAETLNAQKVF